MEESESKLTVFGVPFRLVLSELWSMLRVILMVVVPAVALVGGSVLLLKDLVGPKRALIVGVGLAWAGFVLYAAWAAARAQYQVDEIEADREEQRKEREKA